MQSAVVERINLLLKRRNVEAQMIKNTMTSVLYALAPTDATVMSNTTSQKEVTYFNIAGTVLRFKATTTKLTTTSQMPQTRAELSQCFVCSSGLPAAK